MEIQSRGVNKGNCSTDISKTTGVLPLAGGVQKVLCCKAMPLQYLKGFAVGNSWIRKFCMHQVKYQREN